MVAFRSFFQRFGRLGVCVLPAEVLSNELLRVDPEMDFIPSSLRQTASAFGLCFARVPDKPPAPPHPACPDTPPAPLPRT